MGATRLALTMGMIGLGAGAYLALSTTSAFAPYRDTRSTLPRVVLRDGTYGPASAYERAAQDRSRQGETSDDNWNVRPGPQEGSLTVDLPRWAEGTGEWLAFGQRALRTWRAWSEPEDTRGVDSFAYRSRGQDEEHYGYAEDDRLPPRGDAPFASLPQGIDRRDRDDAAGEAARDAADAASDVFDAEAEGA